MCSSDLPEGEHDSWICAVLRVRCEDAEFGVGVYDREFHGISAERFCGISAVYFQDADLDCVQLKERRLYLCVAMHPYYETGWSRNAVYPDLGFDETHFIDDFDQTKILREYITDRELYEKIIDRYESRAANEDLFIMSKIGRASCRERV